MTDWILEAVVDIYAVLKLLPGSIVAFSETVFQLCDKASSCHFRPAAISDFARASNSHFRAWSWQRRSVASPFLMNPAAPWAAVEVGDRQQSTADTATGNRSPFGGGGGGGAGGVFLAVVLQRGYPTRGGARSLGSQHFTRRRRRRPGDCGRGGRRRRRERRRRRDVLAAKTVDERRPNPCLAGALPTFLKPTRHFISPPHFMLWARISLPTRKPISRTSSSSSPA